MRPCHSFLRRKGVLGIGRPVDVTDCCNYRPISLLSVPSKILESVVNDTIVRHIYKANNLVTDKQLAYRAGFSIELLLTQLTETWREAVDVGLVVAVAFIDFKGILKRHSTVCRTPFSK